MLTSPVSANNDGNENIRFEKGVESFSKKIVVPFICIFVPFFFLKYLLMIVNDFILNFTTEQHKNVLRQTKGFRGRSKNCFSVAIRRLQRSWQYAFRDRKAKRREWSKLWIQRINAGTRQYSWRYSQFMNCYNQSGMKLNKKVSLLCINFSRLNLVNSVTALFSSLCPAHYH